MRAIQSFVVVLAALSSTAAVYSQVIYVNAAANGANDGSSWVDAFADLHDALAAATAGDQIWVASGQYLPGPADEDPQSSFELVSGVLMYGGFAGWETHLDERDWKANETILLRDLPALEVVSAAPILVGQNLAEGSLMDGLIVRDGYNWPPHGPGGLLLHSSNFLIQNCTFENNQTIDDLGGAAVYATATSLHVISSVFKVNKAVGADGGGIRVKDSTLIASDSHFVGNHSGGGTAINAENSETVVDRCTFEQNVAIFSFGSIRAVGPLHVKDSVFLNDFGQLGALGGSGDWLIENCEFLDNPGAIRFSDFVQGAHLKVVDSNFIGNKSSGGDGGAIGANGAPTVEIDGCLFKENVAALFGGALALFEANATIRDSKFIANESQAARGGAIWSGAFGSQTQLTLVNCEVLDNFSPLPGSGIFAGPLTLINSVVANKGTVGVVLRWDSASTIINSTIGSNPVALLVEGGSHVNVQNSIIWSTGGSCAGACGFSSGGCFCDELCCSLGDCCPDKFEVCGGCKPSIGTFNVSHSVLKGVPGAPDTGDDPMFVDPENGDFRLQPRSPAIDAGDNSFVPDPDEFPGAETDLDGNPRIIDGSNDGIAIVDLGAYEFQPSAPTIPGDLNGDGSVGVADLLILLTSWGPCADCAPGSPGNCPADLDSDCAVGVADLLILLSNWG